MLTEKQKVNAAIKGIVRKGSKIEYVHKWNINPMRIQAYKKPKKRIIKQET